MAENHRSTRVHADGGAGDGPRGGSPKHYTPLQSVLLGNLRHAHLQQQQQKPKGFSLVNGAIDDPIEAHVILFDKEWSQLVPLQSGAARVGPLVVGHAASIGWRPTMDDACLYKELQVVATDGHCVTAQLLAISDGHGGNDASTFLIESLGPRLTAHLAAAHTPKHNEEAISAALHGALADIDAAYRGEGGATALLALFIGGELWVANVGDSRAILCHGPAVQQLTVDQKPTIPKYRKEIEALGGFVEGGRLNGILDMARSIGDHYILNVFGEPCVSAVPEVTRKSRGLRHGEYLVLACDGLWDVAASAEVGEAIRQMCLWGEQPEAMARRLVYSAIAQNGSTDNVTVLIAAAVGAS